MLIVSSWLVEVAAGTDCRVNWKLDSGDDTCTVLGEIDGLT